MADFFLSNLKSTLDNCITELDEMENMFWKMCLEALKESGIIYRNTISRGLYSGGMENRDAR